MNLKKALKELTDEWEMDGIRIGYDSREQHENDFLAGVIVPALRRLMKEYE